MRIASCGHFPTPNWNPWRPTFIPSSSRSTTHEFLALMLGVNRPTVTLSAAALADAGLISYSRGVMTILDRPGLERAACECYASTVAELKRLLPEP
jgi:hypothetical protein